MILFVVNFHHFAITIFKKVPSKNGQENFLKFFTKQKILTFQGRNLWNHQDFSFWSSAIFKLIGCSSSPTCNKIPKFILFLLLYFSCRSIWLNPLLEQHEKIEKKFKLNFFKNPKPSYKWLWLNHKIDKTNCHNNHHHHHFCVYFDHLLNFPLPIMLQFNAANLGR